MNNKVTIIGAGSVGATVAYTLVVDSPVSEIVLIDIKKEKALGEALDIKQATPFLSPVQIYAGSYEDAVIPISLSSRRAWAENPVSRGLIWRKPTWIFCNRSRRKS